MYLLRKPMLALSSNTAIRDLIASAPVTRDVVRRFVAGATTADAVAAVRRLRAAGLAVTCDYLGEDTGTARQATATVDAYLELIGALDAEGLAAGADLSVKLSAIGRTLPAGAEAPDGGVGFATAAARRIVTAAETAGATVTLDMEDHTSVGTTLAVLRELRTDAAEVGVAIQAMLLRTPGDLAELTGPGSRVRLVKGAYSEPAAVAHTSAHEVDLAYVRALKQLMAGDGYPMIGTHDPRLVAIADRIAAGCGRSRGSWEYQMLYGIRPDEQSALVRAGHRVRVYLPYGTDWYGYFTRRLAERPANLAFFLKSLTSTK